MTFFTQRGQESEMSNRLIWLAGSVLGLALLGACSSAYYKTMEGLV